MSWKLRGKQLRLYTGPLQFNGITWDSKARGFLLSWVADTEVRNIFYIRFIAVGLHWPPIRWLSGFMNEDEEDDQEQL